MSKRTYTIALRGECNDCGREYHESWPGCPYCQAWLPLEGETDEECGNRRAALVADAAARHFGVDRNKLTVMACMDDPNAALAEVISDLEMLGLEAAAYLGAPAPRPEAPEEAACNE